MIRYARETGVTAQEFHDVLVASSLGERRPVHDLARLDEMLRGAQIVITARDQGRLVGIARAITDFCYCCYLSDLAVDRVWQRQGIGKRLIAETHAAAGERASLYLNAAPAAEAYYPHIGMQRRPSSWFLPRMR